jgi:hypothetical protein
VQLFVGKAVSYPKQLHLVQLLQLAPRKVDLYDFSYNPFSETAEVALLYDVSYKTPNSLAAHG